MLQANKSGIKRWRRAEHARGHKASRPGEFTTPAGKGNFRNFLGRLRHEHCRGVSFTQSNWDSFTESYRGWS